MGTIKEKTVRGKYHLESVNGFIQTNIMETSDGSFMAQMKFKKRGKVFLNIVLTHSQLMSYLKDGVNDSSFSAPAVMYGVSDESIIHLYNMDLHVTTSEMKSYIAMQQSLQKAMNQRVNKLEFIGM